MYGVNTVMLQLYPRSPTSFEPPVFMSTVPLLSQNFLCDCGVNRYLLPKMVLGKMHSIVLDPTGVAQRRRATAGLPPMTVDDVYELFDKMPVLCGWSPAVFGGYPTAFPAGGGAKRLDGGGRTNPVALPMLHAGLQQVLNCCWRLRRRVQVAQP